MINTLLELGQEVESTVEKNCDTYDEATKYVKEMKDVDDKLDKIL